MARGNAVNHPLAYPPIERDIASETTPPTKKPTEDEPLGLHKNILEEDITQHTVSIHGDDLLHGSMFLTGSYTNSTMPEPTYAIAVKSNELRLNRGVLEQECTVVIDGTFAVVKKWVPVPKVDL